MVVPLFVSDETQSELNSIELAGVEAMKPPTAARIDPPIEVVMKDLVEKYRPVGQRTVRSETTKDKAGALPPAVYYAQPPFSKVMFHDDSTGEGQEGMEQIMPQVTDDDGDSHVPSITFVNDSTVGNSCRCVTVNFLVLDVKQPKIYLFDVIDEKLLVFSVFEAPPSRPS
ncbi:hypothetical protein AWC38_SpisGene9387 [Stylophora pistillata]|uniref:Uncharacterized protein n=1 Tax=Stylophora pistillata TaxID=50429 RepID=A0A2B4SBJ0_STYPI|nr:hypothetical protein AWC38_SpisGene9387 [Stylophora pistillata]